MTRSMVGVTGTFSRAEVASTPRATPGRRSSTGLGVTAKLANAAQNTSEAAGDTYSSIENLTGSNFNDTLEGDGGANTINGGLGTDIMNGLGDNDTYFVNAVTDQVNEATEQGFDHVIATSNYVMASATEVEKLTTGLSDPHHIRLVAPFGLCSAAQREDGTSAFVLP